MSAQQTHAHPQEKKALVDWNVVDCEGEISLWLPKRTRPQLFDKYGKEVPDLFFGNVGLWGGPHDDNRWVLIYRDEGEKLTIDEMYKMGRGIEYSLKQMKTIVEYLLKNGLASKK